MVRTQGFYRSVLLEAEAAALAEAETAEGLVDEVALLRVLVRRHLAERPQNLELTIKALHLLVRMVAEQFRLSGADRAGLTECVDAVAAQLTTAVLGEEAAHG